MNRSARLRLVSMTGAALAALTLASACSSSGAAVQSHPKSGAPIGETVVAAKQAFAKASTFEDLTFPKPARSFSPGAGSVAIISCGQAGSICAQGSADVADAAKAIGWQSSPILDGKFSSATQSGYVEQAIRQHYSAIVLIAIEPDALESAINDAARAKVPVVCINCLSDDGGKVTRVAPDAAAAGVSMANWVIADSNGKANVEVFEDPAYPSTVQTSKAEAATLRANCPGCHVTGPTNGATDKLTAPNPPVLTSALAANPKGALGYVMAPYDSAAVEFTKALQQAGRTEVKVSGSDAIAITLSEMGACECFGVTTASPWTYEAWAAIDEAARLKAGLPPWPATTMPVLAITRATVGHYAKESFDPRFDFKAMFAQLWNK